MAEQPTILMRGPAPKSGRIVVNSVRMAEKAIPAAGPAWSIADAAPERMAQKSAVIHFTDGEWNALETLGLRRNKSANEAAVAIVKEWLYEHRFDLGGLSNVAAKSLYGSD